ncbi:hypothetical protein [Amycolatopsis palatopharyngis]|uniref:hypothetical protein n=1 Tax=Amycolatopsis palatopharyngis TaxID=187982 RepID=UPI000E282965|nr:hypothetical protein [Amycolatopsis palatopharyngis]
MRVTPIPDSAVWPGARRQVIAPPDGCDPTGDIRPVEAVVDESSSIGCRVLSVRCALDPGDLETLAAHGNVWISFYGAMVPFNVDIVPNTEVDRG